MGINMAFLWGCFLLFGKVIIGSILWILALGAICTIIGLIAFAIGHMAEWNKKKPEPPAKGKESEGNDFTWQ